MTAYGFLWAADVSLLLALVGVGGLARALWGWKPFPILLAACLMWLADIGLLRFLQGGLVPVGAAGHIAGAAAAAQALTLWAALTEEGDDGAARETRAALLVFLCAICAAIIAGAGGALHFRAPEWVFFAAGCLPPAAALGLWAAGKFAPRHFLLQGFVFLLLAAALEFTRTFDPAPGGFFQQLGLLALGFAFFSLILHAAQEGRSREAERVADELPRLLAGYLATLRAILKSRDEQAALPTEQTTTPDADPARDADPVTRLLNFSAFQRSLGEAMREADMQSRRFALVFVDIDGLSRINRLAGFETGDRILRVLGEGISRLAPPELAGRIGGDEFAVILFGDPDAVVEKTKEMLADLRHEMDSVYEGVGMKSAYALYPLDFFEQSGVFRRMREAAGAEPARVKSY